MGEAIWEFLWCIDKTTLEENGVGWVLGKHAVAIDLIAHDLSESRRTAQYHLETLKEHKYIVVNRVKTGLVIGVLKSKKWSVRKDLTSDERVILAFLKQIPNYPFDYQRDLEFLRTLRVDFPRFSSRTKILEELKKWKVWLWDNAKKLRGQKVNYRSRFRNWLKNEEKYAQNRRTDRRSFPESEAEEGREYEGLES